MRSSFSIKTLITEKNPALARKIPAVGYYFLERIAHTRELARFIRDTAAAGPRDALGCALRRLRMSYHVRTVSDTTIERILANDARLTVASNHPFGGADALVLLDLLTARFGHVAVPANDLVRVVAPVAPLFVPVNKHGSNPDLVRTIDEVFSGDAPVLVFPAGRTGRPPRGTMISQRIIEFPWAKTFVKKSRTHGRLIVPVFVDGRNSWVFYFIAWIRTRLAIRANLEMFLLVDELVRRRGSTVELVVGPAIDTSRLDARFDDAGWAERIRTYVRALGDGVDDDFFSWLDRCGLHARAAVSIDRR
ncbi:MAG: hypothetical protein EA426_12165 [Spirochaetaceae bacterium]|nr:MAG: hypothetical protein EA426_12165 [Spirochaetaceae bacterium]